MKRVVMGIVDTPEVAQAAVRRLVALGFSPREVSVLYPDRHGDHDFGFEASTKAPEGALMGIGFGAIIGSMVGLALGLAGAVPGLALLARTGPLLLAASGAVVGALLLGLLGAALGAATPEIEAKYYEGKVRRGSILVAAHTRGRAEVRCARQVLTGVAASDIHAAGEAPVPIGSRA